MKKKIVLSVLVIVLVLATCVGVLVGCKKVPAPFDAADLQVYMENDYYAGTSTYVDGEISGSSVDLANVPTFKDHTISKVTGKATLSGTVLTVTGAGEFAIEAVNNKDGKSEKRTFKGFAVDAVNATTAADFVKAIKDGKSVVAQDNFAFEKSVGNIVVSANTTIYGNGRVFDATKIAEATKDESGSSVFVADGENVTMRDFKVTGKVLTEEEKKTFDLSSLERYGALVTYYTGDPEKKLSGLMKNLIIENSHKVVEITGAEVVMEGCIVMNAADSLVSIGTFNNGGTKLTMKNNVLINSVVAGIVCYGWDNVTEEKNFLDLKIEGFLDIYNWKEKDSAKIMPGTETGNGLVNGLVSTELGASKNKKYIYNFAEKKYIHSGIVVLGTGKLKDNKAKINGTVASSTDGKVSTELAEGKDLKFVVRSFPIPPAASMFGVNTCRLIGYGNDQEAAGIALTPDKTIGDNLKIMEELRNGRK